MSTKRTWVIEEAEDPETGQPLGHYDRDQLLACMEEVEHVLYMVGGMVAFATDRVKIGEEGGEPLAVSRRVFVTWSAFAPMRDEGAQRPAVEPGDEMLEEAAEELAGQLEGPDDEDEDEEIDRSLTTTGPPRPDATF